MFALSCLTARRLGGLRPAIASVFVRNLNVHEHVSMDLLKAYGIKVPQCHVANAPDEASHIFGRVLNNRKYVHVCVYGFRLTTHVSLCSPVMSKSHVLGLVGLFERSAWN